MFIFLRFVCDKMRLRDRVSVFKKFPGIIPQPSFVMWRFPPEPNSWRPDVGTATHYDLLRKACLWACGFFCFFKPEKTWKSKF